MLRTSRVHLQSEFENKTRWSWVWKPQRYGTIFLQKGCHRRIPMYNLKWVTKDSNRLSNFSERYKYVIKEFDVEKNKEAGVEVNDVRWNDYRFLKYKCQKCGTAYAHFGHTLIRYRGMCPRCKIADPTVLEGQFHVSPTVAVGAPDLLNRIDASESRDYVGGLRLTSRALIKMKCDKCTKAFTTSVRAATGHVEDQQAPLKSRCQDMRFCEDCRWSHTMAAVARDASSSGSFLGLDESFKTLSSKKRVA